MKIVESFSELKDFLDSNKMFVQDNCVLAVIDNKSDVLLQYIVVENPISFIRGIQEFCGTLKVPVSDVDVVLVGFLNRTHEFNSCEHIVISPYVYFKKAEDSEVSKDA